MVSRIVVLDPNGEERLALERDLNSLGYRTFATGQCDTAYAFLRSEQPTLVFCDVAVLSESASDLMYSLCQGSVSLSLIIVDGVTAIDSVADAVRRGAAFYLLRPITQENLKRAIERAIGLQQPKISSQSLGPPLQPGSTETVVGASNVIMQSVELAERVARSDANIVIFGESGTGKELFAKMIHARSSRSGGAFIPVDCASLPDNLLEAELFGYEKGAFTGADHMKPGVMELANRGTLFFDEIAELPMSLQLKLLRALQERQHRRLGGSRIVSFDLRVVSATNRDLRGLVSERQFREDLFYRLNVIPLKIPSLRARKKDVVLLANHFLEKCSRKVGCLPKRFDPEVLGVFEGYSWPGNVRELQNVVEYGCAVARTDTITLRDIPDELFKISSEIEAAVLDSSQLGFKEARTRFESGYLASLLKRGDNNVSRAAKMAGVDRKTLYLLLKRNHVHYHS
jgi:DNA-binding NtrC family response regulator